MEQPNNRTWPGRGRNKAPLYTRRMVKARRDRLAVERAEEEFDTKKIRFKRRWQRHDEEMRRMVAGDGSRL